MTDKIDFKQTTLLVAKGVGIVAVFTGLGAAVGAGSAAAMTLPTVPPDATSSYGALGGILAATYAGVRLVERFLDKRNRAETRRNATSDCGVCHDKLDKLADAMTEMARNQGQLSASIHEAFALRQKDQQITNDALRRLEDRAERTRH